MTEFHETEAPMELECLSSDNMADMSVQESTVAGGISSESELSAEHAEQSRSAFTANIADSEILQESYSTTEYDNCGTVFVAKDVYAEEESNNRCSLAAATPFVSVRDDGQSENAKPLSLAADMEQTTTNKSCSNLLKANENSCSNVPTQSPNSVLVINYETYNEGELCKTSELLGGPVMRYNSQEGKCDELIVKAMDDKDSESVLIPSLPLQNNDQCQARADLSDTLTASDPLSSEEKSRAGDKDVTHYGMPDVCLVNMPTISQSCDTPILNRVCDGDSSITYDCQMADDLKQPLNQYDSLVTASSFSQEIVDAENIVSATSVLPSTTCPPDQSQFADVSISANYNDNRIPAYVDGTFHFKEENCQSNHPLCKIEPAQSEIDVNSGQSIIHDSASVGCNEPHVSASGSITVHSEQSLTFTTTESASLIKTEPPDSGYESMTNREKQLPLQANLNFPKQSENVGSTSTSSSGSTSSGNTTTTIMKQGKKRIRVTIIRGERKTPPQNKIRNTSTLQVVSERSENSQNKESNPVLKVVPEVPALPSSSAFPTALYRNVHVKQEPADDGYPDSQLHSSLLHPETSSHSSHAQGAADSQNQSMQSLSSTSSSQSYEREGRQHGGHEGERGVQNPSGSSITGSNEDFAQCMETTQVAAVESQFQNCYVRLKTLHPDIVAAGRVDLRTISKVMRTYSNQIKDHYKPAKGARQVIKVSDPVAFHPKKKRDKLGSRPWPCELCDKTFKTASARSQHKKVHLGIKDHKCDVCGKAFTYKSTLTAHRRSHTDERPYVCKLCGAGFNWIGILNNHLTSHSKTKCFKCEQCGKTFTQKANLTTHLKRHSRANSFKCFECDLTFLSKSEVVSHMRTHTGEKPFQCTQCSARFTHKNTLVVHLRSHNDERPYQCHLCSLSFRQSSHRAAHIHLRHEKPQKEGYTPRKQRKQINRGPRTVVTSDSVSGELEDAVLVP